MSDVNIVQKQAGTILSDDIYKYFFYLFCVVLLWHQFRNLIVTLCTLSKTSLRVHHTFSKQPHGRESFVFNKTSSTMLVVTTVF
jgi:hypothetical protein